jgi:hypothetical protein
MDVDLRGGAGGVGWGWVGVGWGGVGWGGVGWGEVGWGGVGDMPWATSINFACEEAAVGC